MHRLKSADTYAPAAVTSPNTLRADADNRPHTMAQQAGTSRLELPSEDVIRFALSSGALEEYGTLPDGDCLFSSVEAILRTASPSCASKINDSMKRAGANFDCAVTTAAALRVFVASRVLDPDDHMMNTAIATWIEIARCAQMENDHALLSEYRHVLPVLQCKDTQKLSTKDRTLLFHSMCRRQYWGEQIALQILRKLTGVMLLVFDERGKLMFQFESEGAAGDSLAAKIYGLLHLSGRHFQPIGYKGQLCFPEQDLPFAVADMLVSPACNESVSDHLKSQVAEARKLLSNHTLVEHIKKRLFGGSSSL